MSATASTTVDTAGTTIVNATGTTTGTAGEPATLDAHRYAAEGMTAAVVHAMLVQPAREDVASALEHRDWERAIAAAIECIRWVAAGQEMLDGGSVASTGVEVDLSIAATTRADPIDALRDLTGHGGRHTAGLEHRARLAADAAEAAEARFAARLPLRMPVRRTPTGYRPAAEVASQLEQLRHRLGLPFFDWEAWIG